MRRTVLLLGWTVFAASACVAPVPTLAAQPEIVAVERVVNGPAALDEFRRPVAVAVDASRGVFVVADAGDRRLALFDQTGRARGTMGVPSGADGSAGEPRAVAVDARGRIFVLDEITHRVRILNVRGSVLGELDPRPPSVASADAHPRDIALGASGDIYVLFAGERPGVVVLDPRGEPRTTLGFGTEHPRLVGPVSIGVSPDEALVAVTDPQAEHQVVVFRRDGTVARTFGAHEEAKDGFSMAVDVTWGPGRTLWVTDTIRHSISVFLEDGSYLGRMGGLGGGPGQFNYPAACEFLAANRVVVVERAGARFQILEVAPPAAANRDVETESPLGLVFKEEDQP